MSIFKKFRDPLLSFAEDKAKYNLRFPLKKTGNVLNNYTRGDFIVIGGRKTSGKSSFILNNYVISPIIQKLAAKKEGKPFDLKILYLNTRRNAKTTIERMIVNYISQKNGGTKIGVPSLYGFDGNHAKITSVKAKSIISSAMNVFEKFAEKGILTTISSRKSMYEVDNIIRETMEEYGEYDEETGVFTYLEEHEDLIPIVAIDDITGIFTESGSNNIRNENAHQLAIKLKSLAKIYNIIIVLAVPSAQVYIRAAGHRSTLEEVAPYGMYADRVVILHNPMETYENQMMGYQTNDFTNQKTGLNYLRTIFIASNYMGASGIYFGCFLFPENGFMIELPPGEDIEGLDHFHERVRDNN